jgi:predicted alpha/beta-hydrolase family hydrolase
MPTGGARMTRPSTPPGLVTDRTALARRGEELHIFLDGGRLSVVPAPGAPPADAPLGDAAAGRPPAGSRGLVVLLHGAGTGTDSGVLVPLREHLLARGLTVGRLDMPYRVAGRRAPDRPARLDAVLRAALAALPRPRPVALAGRSMGARVACRCAREAGAVGVLALGFPLMPPARSGRPRPSRADELRGAGAPVLVVQGERDAFGRPEPEPDLGIEVRIVPGADHSFATRRADGRQPGEAVEEAARLGADWLWDRLTERESRCSDRC